MGRLPTPLLGAALLFPAACGVEDGYTPVEAAGEPTPDLVPLDSQASTAQSTDLDYTGPSAQFYGTFVPPASTLGGFGGGLCTPTRVPVVFVPGNGEPSRNWDYPSPAGPSVYERFRDAGYQPCELFGVDYLTPAEQAAGQDNFHEPSKTDAIAEFIAAVLAHTGASQVDLVTHSMGVTMSLQALETHGSVANQVRRFIGIGGAMRGLSSCLYVGPANPLAPTCGSAHWFASGVFGFHPHSWWTPNPKMADGGLRDTPRRLTHIEFYTLRADVHDQIACTTATFVPGCGLTSTFDSRSNVRAQLDVGAGSTAARLDYDFSDWSPYVAGAGDVDGVGHFRSKTATGQIMVQMLTTSCQGASCCGSYPGACQ